MEFIIELFFGIIELGTEKCFPMPIRILCLLILLIFFLGLGGLVFYTGYISLLQNHIVPGVLLVITGCMLVIYGLFVAVKMFRKKRKTDEK